MFGSIDFQVDLGIGGEDDALLMFRSQMVLASRLAGLRAPVDGVSTAIDDIEALRADAERARRLGFGAKLCIHPKQVAGRRERARTQRGRARLGAARARRVGARQGGRRDGRRQDGRQAGDAASRAILDDDA
jgi:citrate lyase subunit beta/citryl-CoA lyase